jgi:xanthine dehydrogenase small subunit
VLDGKIVSPDFGSSPRLTPTTTVLNYLRGLPVHKGVKEGCAEGDCGACTVVVGELGGDGRLRYRAVDSCLVLLPMLHGKQLITVENLNGDRLHPVQVAMVETNGSQCGFCTPGFVMSLFSLYKNSNHPSREEIDDALTGNLCRCTGYKPIIQAAADSCVHEGIDLFTGEEPRVAGLLRSIRQESIRLTTDEQVYFRPASTGEAITLKHEHPDAILICGATDVALRVTKRHELLEEIIDLSGIEEMRSITDDGASMRIGAGACLSDVMAAVQEYFPALGDMLAVFGSRQIRNLATLGGNLGTASPIGDTLPVLLAYGARIVVEGINGRRELPLDGYFTGYRKTQRKPDELITSIILPKQKNGAIVRAYKVSKRKDLDISTVSAGIRLELNSGKISSLVLAYGGMAERVKRARSAEQNLLGKAWSRESVEQAMELIDRDFTPLSDARSGAEFRKLAARNLLLKFWSDTIAHHQLIEAQ